MLFKETQTVRDWITKVTKGHEKRERVSRLSWFFVRYVLILGLALSACGPASTPLSPTPTQALATAVVTTLAGGGRTGPLGGGYADGPALEAQFHEPSGLAVDTAGNVYVSDWRNHRIRVVTPDGQVKTVAGSGPSGPRGGYVDGLAAQARFFGPEGLAVDGQGNLFLADSRNNCIRRIAPDGKVTTVAGSGQPGLLENLVDGPGDQARFGQPSDVAVSRTGTLYVADFLHHCIRKITADGMVSIMAGNGLPCSEDGIGMAASFELPNRIAIDQAGNLYVTEGRARDLGERLGGNRVRKIAPDGTVAILAGTGEPGYRDGPAGRAMFDIPTGVAVDEAGNVYVADTGNHCIRKIGTDGIVTTMAGSGNPGYADGLAAEAEFWYPTDVAVASDGTLYVTDYKNHRVRKITLH
jgi:sugar lactone lactonase YvrE